MARDSSNQAALNNVSTLYGRVGDIKKGIATLELATRVPRPFGGAFTNLVQAYVSIGDAAGAVRTLQEFKRRLPSNSTHWFAEVVIAGAKGQLDSAGAIAERAYREARSGAQRDQSSFMVGAVAFTKGKPMEGLRWYALGNVAALQGGDSKTPGLIAGLDSTFATALFLEDRKRARALYDRAVARVPLESLAPSERPWEYVAEVATLLGDAPMARAALASARRDSAAAGFPAGRDAWYRAVIARTEGRYKDAIAEFQQARRAYYRGERYTNYVIGDAFDLDGQADSALVYYERFAQHPLSDLEDEANYIAGTFKRIGELYDAKGDTAKAEHYYQRFVDLWKDAEPELQPKVRRARERIAELRRSKG